jgi:hypothetical protein
MRDPLFGTMAAFSGESVKDHEYSRLNIISTSSVVSAISTTRGRFGKSCRIFIGFTKPAKL